MGGFCRVVMVEVVGLVKLSREKNGGRIERDKKRFLFLRKDRRKIRF